MSFVRHHQLLQNRDLEALLHIYPVMSNVRAPSARRAEMVTVWVVWPFCINMLKKKSISCTASTWAHVIPFFFKKKNMFFALHVFQSKIYGSSRSFHLIRSHCFLQDHHEYLSGPVTDRRCHQPGPFLRRWFEQSAASAQWSRSFRWLLPHSLFFLFGFYLL